MAERKNEEDGVWVFGYGSLCWHPGFAYTRSTTGYVRGFGRRFWQGNTTHRGTADKPGRVATLVEEDEAIVYGRAFRIEDSAALPYLEKRECSLGGYLTTISSFYTRGGEKSFPVIIYIATNENKHWLGDAPLRDIAGQIVESSGPSGHNVEYLLRLADFMHRYLPEADDEHLFALELLVLAKIEERKMCLTTLMGNKHFAIDLDDEQSLSVETRNGSHNNETRPVTNHVRENSSQYTSRVPTKTLRRLTMQNSFHDSVRVL